jgi:predicted ATPase
VYDWFRSAVDVRLGGPGPAGARLSSLRMLEDPDTAAVVTELLASADLGIESVGVDVGPDPADAELIAELRQALRHQQHAAASAEQECYELEHQLSEHAGRLGEGTSRGKGDARAREQQERAVAAIAERFHEARARAESTRSAILSVSSELARREQRPRNRPKVWFEQRGRTGTVRMDLASQSDGTRMLLDLAGPALTALRHGGVLAVDEVDSSLHPRLTAHLIRLFQDVRSNPLGAQLLLSTHDASLLGRSDGEDILKRDQIWFVEKDRYGESKIFPLSDFKPRTVENRERRYLGGSYGAVPYLSDERLVEALQARGGADGTEQGA